MKSSHQILQSAVIASEVPTSSWEGAIENLQGISLLVAGISQFWAWMYREVFEKDSLYELVIIASLIMLAFFLGRKAQRGINKKIHSTDPKSRFGRIGQAVSIAIIPFIFYFLSLVIVTITNFVNLDDTLITLFANLSGAWGIIRFVTILASDSFKIKVVAFVLWVVSAIYLSGTLGFTLEWLTTHRVDVSSLHASVLDILGTSVLVMILLWAVSFGTTLIADKLEHEKGISQSGRQLFILIIKVVAWVIIIAFGLDLLGLDISVITVFSGAFGLGLGFGLKNVFSNLICGFILLIDKAVKPGDIIRVDGVWGELTSLKARYSTIVTRSGTEHIIPNEHLITREIENLTHSSSTVRVSIPVAVGYGTDLKLASEILINIANKANRVLTNPGPAVRINELGDNAINMELRIWISDPGKGVGAIRTEVLKRVVEEFEARSISIPFPQLQVHTNSTL